MNLVSHDHNLCCLQISCMNLASCMSCNMDSTLKTQVSSCLQRLKRYFQQSAKHVNQLSSELHESSGP